MKMDEKIYIMKGTLTGDTTKIVAIIDDQDEEYITAYDTSENEYVLQKHSSNQLIVSNNNYCIWGYNSLEIEQIASSYRKFSNKCMQKELGKYTQFLS